MERLIFHVDVNSAYLSWEAVRRVSEGGQDLRLVPAVIGGDPEKRTGVCRRFYNRRHFGAQIYRN